MKPIQQVHALVVDDQRAVSSHIDSALKAIGISSVVWTSDGEAALARFKADPNFADIVISDLTLPGMDGVDLLLKLRAIKPELLFLMLLADPTRQNVLRVREAGTRYVLAKPFSTEELTDHVEEMLRVLNGDTD